MEKILMEAAEEFADNAFKHSTKYTRKVADILLSLLAVVFIWLILLTLIILR